MRLLWATVFLLTHSCYLVAGDDRSDRTHFDNTAALENAFNSGDGFTNVDFDQFFEPWIFVSIPDAGTYSLREVFDVGSVGWAAFEAFGEPIENYDPVNIFTPNVSMYNPGIVVLMHEVECLGDFDGSGGVNIDDLVIFARLYADGNQSADLTGDGVIDLEDQFLFFELATRGCVRVY